MIETHFGQLNFWEMATYLLVLQLPFLKKKKKRGGSIMSINCLLGFSGKVDDFMHV